MNSILNAMCCVCRRKRQSNSTLGQRKEYGNGAHSVMNIVWTVKVHEWEAADGVVRD